MIDQMILGSTWKLVSFQSEDVNGNIFFPLGEDALGYIVFAESHLFSVQIMAKDRSKQVDIDQLSHYRTDVEKQMTRLGYHAYSGKFSVNETESVLTTEVELSLITDYIGSKQSRLVRLKDNTLYLSNINHPERRLVWEKLN